MGLMVCEQEQGLAAHPRRVLGSPTAWLGAWPCVKRSAQPACVYACYMSKPGVPLAEGSCVYACYMSKPGVPLADGSHPARVR